MPRCDFRLPAWSRTRLPWISTTTYFISYAREDERFARKLYDRLVADGHRVWWDSNKISLPGADIAGSIELGLARSRAFGLIVSKAALNSSWLKTEYAAAVTLNIRDETNRTIIPIVIENVDLPIFLLNRRWPDFRDDASFDPSVRSLGESLRTGLPPPLAPLPEGSRTQLHELMLSAKRELVISGHTLDKFTNPKVLQALYSLFDRNLSVVIVLLNPHSPCALAHDQFHTKESRTSAQNQIRTTIQQLSNILEVADRTPCLSVYLTRYMPRFRIVLIDNSVCHVNLYMYGTDVLHTPELVFWSNPDGTKYHEFVALQQSLQSLLRSQDVIPLIKEGWYDRYWTSSRIESLLGNCIQGLCSQAGCSAVRDVLFGSHVDDAPPALSEQLCPPDYRPGTVYVARIPHLLASRTHDRVPDRIVDKLVEDRLVWLSREYPDCFSQDGRSDLVRKVAAALNRSHFDHSVLWHALYLEQWEDIVDRIVCSVRFGHPEPMLPAASRTRRVKEQMLTLITWLTEHKSPSLSDWLTLSIAAEALPYTTSLSDVAAIGEQLWELGRSAPRIDAFTFFFHLIQTNYQLPMYVVSFPSTLLAALIAMKFYDELLHNHETLHLDFVPRSVNVGTYASYRDVLEVLPP